MKNNGWWDRVKEDSTIEKAKDILAPARVTKRKIDSILSKLPFIMHNKKTQHDISDQSKKTEHLFRI